MSEYRRQILAGGTVAFVVAVIVIASALYLPGLGNSTNRPTSRFPYTTTMSTVGTSSSNHPLSAKTTNSSLGLELTLSINSSTMTSSSASRGISLDIQLYNILSQTNNLTALDNWPIQNLSIGPCNFELPFGIAVYQGYYTSANISEPVSSSLPLFPTAACPLGVIPDSYSFQPNSYYTTIVSKPMLVSTQPSSSMTTSRQTLVQQSMTDNLVLSGYCCTQVPVGGGGYTSGSIPFAAGNYTLVGGDMWGQLVILHFVVTAPATVEQTTTSSLSSLGNPTTTSASQQSTSISSSVVGCSTTYSNYTINSASVYLAKESGSVANLCVRYFYYNATNPITINTLDQLTIYSPTLSSGTLSNVNSSFSISANIQKIQLGGPQSANEGTLVTYTIRSIGSAPSGTYEIGLSSALYPQDVVCGWGIYVSLQVGNTTNPIVMSFCHYVPAPQDAPGSVYSEIVGITNSTS